MMLLKKLARRVLKAKTSLKLTRQSRFRIWEALEAKFDDFEMYVKNL
jgi:hypothetical protein